MSTPTSLGDVKDYVESSSSKSDQGNASFDSDSSALGETDVEPVDFKGTTWLLTVLQQHMQTDKADNLSTQTDRTVVGGMTDQVLLAKPTVPSLLPGPRPKIHHVSSNTQKVQQWLATEIQPSTMQHTPSTLTVQAVSHTMTEMSSLLLGMEAANYLSCEPSHVTTRSRYSRQSSRSNVTDAMINFGPQITNSLMCLADKTVQLTEQFRQDVA